MATDSRGDLRERSKSFAEMVLAYREKAFDTGFDKLFDKSVELALGDGLPDDVADHVADHAKLCLRALAQIYLPGSLRQGERLAGKLDPLVARSVKALAPLGLSAGKLLLAGRAMGTDPDAAGLRLVDSALTFEEARRTCRWSGTLTKARIGTVLTGPADPTRYFVLYAPARQVLIRSSFAITIVQRLYG